MSRIGTIEKLNVASVLQRIEEHSKTGLLVVKQDTRWVEFYCREGRLLCVGPIRTDATLGERLLQDGVISVQELQETMRTIGNAVPSETHIALTLIDLGYVTREELRAWTGKKTEVVLSAVLSWSTGELDFEENADVPSERLLVSLSIPDLLAALPPRNTSSQVTPVIPTLVQEHTTVEATHTNSTEAGDSRAATAYNSTRFPPEPALSQKLSTITSADTLLPISSNVIHTDPVVPFVPRQTPPPLSRVPATALPSKRGMDTSFMQPYMVLVPADLSSLPEQHIQVTPEQWRLLTRVNGSTSLGAACAELGMRDEQVCRVAGELIAEQIVQIVSSPDNEAQELSPTSQNLLQSGFSNELGTPSYAPTVWSTMPPVSQPTPEPPSTYETYSQWGNGGNGTMFIQGRGWVAPVQNTFENGRAYTSIGNK